MEALNKAYAGRGVSFYYVLSREPHPGFYGFTQTDSLEQRKEYVRLADAELQIQLPWIIDDMENTMQKTYGRMPNAEFIIDSDGTLLESREWADPSELKAFLEERIGPSGISDEEWEELGKRDQTMLAIGNNDEVPATEVPRAALHSLEAEYQGEAGTLPFSFEVGTLPPNITPEGQSRLYLTIKPLPEINVSFDKAIPITVELSDVNGIKFIKDQLESGKRRSRNDTEDDLDVYPHTLGVLWELEEEAAHMGFRATVTALVKTGDQDPIQVVADYLVSGEVPELQVATDEISPSQFFQDKELMSLQSVLTETEIVPMSVEVKVLRDPETANQGIVYFILKVDDATGHKWNNLSAPPHVDLKPVSGIALEKNTLYAAQHSGDEDSDDRILAVRFTLKQGSKEFSLDAIPKAWICNNELGWCRIFSATFRITGKF